MKWIKASERLPNERRITVFRWSDLHNSEFTNSLNEMKDENGNIPGLVLLEWLDESDTTDIDAAREEGRKEGAIGFSKWILDYGYDLNCYNILYPRYKKLIQSLQNKQQP